MSQTLTLDVRGLHTFASPLSGVPSGSLSVANNININRNGIIEPRRGYGYLTYSLPTNNYAAKILFWHSELFVHHNSTFSYYDTNSGYVSRGTISKPTNSTSIRSVSSLNKNLYLSTSNGIYKTDSVAASLYAAGIPKGTVIELSLVGTGTALENNYYSTYRYVLGRRDANGNMVFGGVSTRATIGNTTGTTQNVTVKCWLPSGLNTTYFLQLYKINSSVSNTSDELQLCYETPISSTDLSNGYCTITDITPYSLVGAYLYTSPSQQGISSDNNIPPLARDIAEYKNYLWFADIDVPQRLSVNLISVGGTGLVLNDTITITLGATTEVYTAYGSFDAANKRFQISTGGTISQNIDNTIKSFIKCVNIASSIVSCYSLSTSDSELPGKVYFEAKTTSATTFSIVSSRSAAFQPQLTSPATTSNTSSAETHKNGLMFSKQNQQEAVPAKNLLKVGSSDDRIRRIVAGRDCLFILKEKDGIYTLRGNSEADFNISLLDNTSKLTAPDSVAVINNYLYMLCDNGVVEVSDTGVSIISNPIKDQILALFGDPLEAVKQYSFAVGSDVDGKYVLSVPTSSTDTSCNKQFVYDVYGKTWVTWDMKLTAGAIHPTTSSLYFGRSDINTVITEKRSFSYTDFADYQQTTTISAFDGTTVYLNGTASMAIGDILYQGTASVAYIEAIDTVSGSVTIDTAQSWTTGTADVVHVSGIDCAVQWNPDFGGNPGELKQYYECSLIYKQTFSKAATVFFSSDINPAESSISINSVSGNGEFGQFVFGEEVYGGEQAYSPRRLGVPRIHSVCTLLSVRFENKIAFSDFQLTGLSLCFNPISTAVAR